MSSSIHGIVLKLVWEVLIDEGLDLIQDGSSITLADPNDVIICPGPGVLGSWVERYLQTSTCQVTNAAAAAQPAKNLKVGIGLGSAPGKIKLPMGWPHWPCPR